MVPHEYFVINLHPLVFVRSVMVGMMGFVLGLCVSIWFVEKEIAFADEQITSINVVFGIYHGMVGFFLTFLSAFSSRTEIRDIMRQYRF